MRLKNKGKKYLFGFSLVEMLIVICILGVIAAVVTPLVIATMDSWLFNKTERDLVFSARLSINRMTREIRQIKDASYITTFTETEFGTDTKRFEAEIIILRKEV